MAAPGWLIVPLHDRRGCFLGNKGRHVFFIRRAAPRHQRRAVIAHGLRCLRVLLALPLSRHHGRGHYNTCRRGGGVRHAVVYLKKDVYNIYSTVKSRKFESRYTRRHSCMIMSAWDVSCPGRPLLCHPIVAATRMVGIYTVNTRSDL